MAGQLIQVATETVTSAVAEVSFTNIDTDCVYMVAFNNVQPATDNKDMRVQLKNGATTLTPYSKASKDLRTDTTFSNNSSSGATRFDLNAGQSNASAETGQGIFYLYNFQNSSEYSFLTYETAYINFNSSLFGQQGGGVVTQASACDTIVFYWESASNFATGSQFTLYKVV